MFDNTYIENVHLTDSKRGTGSHRLTKTYSFKGSASMYIVEVESYLFDIYVLKFYLKAHRQSDKKFNLLSEDNDAQGVIRTVLDIAIDILKYENPKASFGFIGSHKISNKGTESLENTQRFRIYRSIMRNYFGDLTWYHYESIDSSSYLMLNRCFENPDEIIEEIAEMFKGIYDQFEGSNINISSYSS